MGKANETSQTSATFGTMNGKQFAELAGVTKQTVSLWADAGMPCVRTGHSGAAIKIDVLAAVRWHFRRKPEKHNSARMGVAHEQAERLRIQNRKARGELLDANVVEKGIKRAVAGVLQDWDALAQRVTPDEKLQTAIAGECRQAQQRFSDVLREISDDLARRADDAGDD